MGRRQFTRDFKLEAVRLVRDRGVSIAQASRDLDVHETVIRKWVKDFAADPGQACPGHGAMKPDEPWWSRYRAELEASFRQKQIVVRAHSIRVLRGGIVP